MVEVQSSIAPDALVVPYALWPHHQVLAQSDMSALPALRQWLRRASCVSRACVSAVDAPSLSMPHEIAQARQRGWPLIDGVLPWAAQAAVQAGLAQAGDGSAWGFVTLCHWQISQGLATMTDPAALRLDDATDVALFEAMQTFFAEDGLVLHRHQPGVWLVQSPGLATLPTASLARVLGEDVDAWLVGSHGAHDSHAAVVKLWRRLQNEMQMLLYTHPLNAQRRVPINSFWLHGTGCLPSGVQCDEPLVDAAHAASEAMRALREAYLVADFQAWLQAWQALDAACFVDASLQEVVLCGAHDLHVYRRQAATTRDALGASSESRLAGWARVMRWLTGRSPAQDWRSALLDVSLHDAHHKGLA